LSKGALEYRWPARSWRFTFDDFTELEHTEVFAEGSVA
jgi:hypothetical protein